MSGDNTTFPGRKSNRLRGYDYSSNGGYFITVCTKNRECILSEITVGGDYIRSFKTVTSKRLGKSIWQRGFYDYILRDEEDYLIRWNYIDGNPSKWIFDEYCL